MAARRLDHHRAAGGQCRRAFAGDHGGREVPGRDGGADPDRLLEHEHPARAHGLRDDVAIDPLRLLGEPLDEGGGVDDLALGFGERLALLAGHQIGEVLLGGHHQVVPLAQDRRALLGGLGTPGRQGLLGRGHRPSDFLDTETGYRADRLAVGGIDDLDGLAALRVDPGAVDIALLAEQALVGKLDADVLECCRHGFLTEISGGTPTLRRRPRAVLYT